LRYVVSPALRLVSLALASCFIAVGIQPGVSAATVSTDDVTRIATDAYIFGYPLVTMDLSRNVYTGKASLYNKFNNYPAFPPPNDHRVVRPNADTLYSLAWLDISKEPVVMHLPNTRGRYYLMPMLDGWTDVFQSRLREYLQALRARARTRTSNLAFHCGANLMHRFESVRANG